MAFIFTCGTHTFQSMIDGHENDTVQCHNCGNWSGKLMKEWPWFTFCFVPIFPLYFKPWPHVFCPVCSRRQPIEQRPDVQQILDGGSAGQQIPSHGGPQGWNNQQQPPAQPPPVHNGSKPQGGYYG